MPNIFKLPDLGEGLPDAAISQWHVKVGDTIKLDQLLVSMETAKAVVDVPSPVTGTIVKLYGEAGDIIDTGNSLVEFDCQVDKTQTRKQDTGTVAGKIEIGNKIINNSVKAVTPAVRALAKKLNVDLSCVAGSGPNNIITAADIKKFEAVTGEPLKGVRRAMAYAMGEAHKSIVPVTVVDDAVLLNWHEKYDISVRVMQAVTQACAAEPALNVWFDDKNNTLQRHQQIDLGIAMDTADGLFVPIIKNIAAKNPAELRHELNILKSQVAARTIAQDKLTEATITVSNFGKFCGRYANPIVIPPQVAIVGIGMLREEVVAVAGNPEVAKVLPLSITVDHRAVTGGEATRFLAAIINSLRL